MRFVKVDRQSIVFRLTFLTVAIVIGQTVLLSLFLVIGGVLSQAEDNAYTYFSEKVSNRKDNLQREMKYHWTNMAPYTKQIAAQYNSEKDPDQFLRDISDSFISMLRSTQATGVFIILTDSSEEKPALYIRDYDPILNDYENSDLYLVYGPAALASDLQIPLDQMWKYRINVSTINADFYEKPLSKASLSTDANLLGYWSVPFKLTQEDNPIITYSMPLLDKKDQLIGVIGVELSEQYLSKFLPATDLQNKDSYGYMLGYRPSEDEALRIVMLTKEIQKRIVREGDILEYTNVDQKHSVYLLKNETLNWKLYLSVQDLGLYGYNTPFEQSRWYLVGIMNENYLLDYVLKIQHILLVSLIASVIIGAIFGYFVSDRFTRPIINVARKVKETTDVKAIKLENTRLTEVDELLEAIQVTSNILLKTSGKMSRIVEMVGLPLGVFEYRDQSDRVFITDQLPRILSLDEQETEAIIKNKERFISIIRKLLSSPEAGEEDIYYVDQVPEKWLKIKYTENDNSTIGVIIDVTDDMAEKKKLLTDRDIDSLTGIYNRKAMQLHMEEILQKRDPMLTVALLMFDLDNLKMVNDTYGHKWGDLYIKYAVKHLSGICENHQILGRRSGDEFAVLLYDVESKDGIRRCINGFYQNLAEHKLRLPDGTKQPVTISAGLAWIEEQDLAFDEYLQMADELLYKAKRTQKGYYCEELK